MFLKHKSPKSRVKDKSIIIPAMQNEPLFRKRQTPIRTKITDRNGQPGLEYVISFVVKEVYELEIINK